MLSRMASAPHGKDGISLRHSAGAPAPPHTACQNGCRERPRTSLPCPVQPRMNTDEHGLRARRRRRGDFLGTMTSEARVRGRDFDAVQKQYCGDVDPNQEDDHSADGAVDAAESREVAHVPREPDERAAPE